MKSKLNISKAIRNIAFCTGVIAMSVDANAQGQAMEHRSIGRIETDGSVTMLLPNPDAKEFLENRYKKVVNKNINITEITIVKNENQIHVLQGIGEANGSGGGVRVELSIKGGKVLVFASNGGTETCTGNPCSHCKFASGGGCNCDGGNVGDKCDHTVEK